MKTTHDCTECPIRKLMEKHFPPERTRDYDITTTDHACGCLEFFEFDDTPGWRSKDYWTDNKNCMLNKEIVDIDEDLDEDPDEDPDGFFMNTYCYDDDSYDDVPGFRD